VLLPSCPSANAADIIERLRTATPAGQTVSAGIAVWASPADSPQENRKQVAICFRLRCAPWAPFCA
jgi:hypothetical protein